MPGQEPLALITEAISGVTLDVPLRCSLERAWRAGHGELSGPDRQLLHGVRRAVQALHECLPPPLRQDPRPLAARLAGLLADVAVVRRSLPRPGPAHGLLDLAARRAVAAAAGAGFLRFSQFRRFLPGAAHGDLHLSNVLVHGGQVRFVDPGSAGAAVLPDDFAALRCGAECLCLDLLVTRVAGDADAGKATAAALRAAAWAAADRPVPGWTPRAALVRDDQTAAIAAVAQRWCAGVVAELAGQRTSQLSELCYLARLLHDLRYHTERGRAYYADLAWWQLATLLLPGPGGTGGPAGGLSR